MAKKSARQRFWGKHPLCEGCGVKKTKENSVHHWYCDACWSRYEHMMKLIKEDKAMSEEDLDASD